eukprot:gnl/Dysnectes_brevis/4459_a6001_424.p1 GENE.gnl/Dysnectes_brevis/4459_a6001_424~~gnl/Dysnectes_brevis/4459_a6001_424.p1  ORF type:complete len:640 (-),score=216.67 gnl/Dysnectes_brevis/4459_a6001_424:42-1961(-)
MTEKETAPLLQEVETETNEAHKQLGILKQWWRLFVMAFPSFRHRNTLWVYLNMIALIIACFCPTQIANISSMLTCSATASCSHSEDDDKFFYYVIMSVSVVFVQSVALSFANWAGWRVGAIWRAAITRRFHSLYFTPKYFYKLNTDRQLDSVDQRISSDVRLYTEVLAGAVEPTTSGVIFGDKGLFSAVLYLIIPSITLFTMNIPAWQIWSLLGVLLLELALTWAVNKPLVRPTIEQEKLEGAFRFHHVTVREGAESVAFYDGGDHEKAIADNQLMAVIKNSHRLVTRKILPRINYYILYVIPVIIPYAFMYFNVLNDDLCRSTDDLILEMTIISETVGGFEMLLNIGPRLAVAVGATKRVTEVAEALDMWDTDDRTTSDEQIPEVVRQVYQAADGPLDAPVPTDRIGWEGVDLVTPDGDALLRGVTAVAEEGQSLVILGPSGSGKSSLLRCLAGLWKPAAGSVIRPEGTFFVPQTPYLANRSLLGEITYPNSPAVLRHDEVTVADIAVGEDELPTDLYLSPAAREEREAAVQALRLCHLDYLLDRFDLDSVSTWSEILSGGEQQRLGLARLLFHSPRFAVMDEATSALPVDLEQAIMAECERRGITMLSVAHRPTVFKHHQYNLDVTKKGWELREYQE